MADDAEAEATVAVPKKKGGGMMKVIVLAGLFIMVAGGGAAWWMLGASTEAAEVEAEPALEARGLVPFEPFLVNLADAGSTRFLKVTVQLVVASPSEAKHIEETPVVLMQLRSAILELLTQEQAPVLVTPKGKEELKQAIKARTGPMLSKQKVLDVLFSEFVVQF